VRGVGKLLEFGAWTKKEAGEEGTGEERARVFQECSYRPESIDK
jgi:hypothetical protein